MAEALFNLVKELILTAAQHHTVDDRFKFLLRESLATAFTVLSLSWTDLHRGRGRGAGAWEAFPGEQGEQGQEEEGPRGHRRVRHVPNRESFNYYFIGAPTTCDTIVFTSTPNRGLNPSATAIKYL